MTREEYEVLDHRLAEAEAAFAERAWVAFNHPRGLHDWLTLAPRLERRGRRARAARWMLALRLTRGLQAKYRRRCGGHVALQ